MKILVTGGYGFIGSAFIRTALGNNYEIINVDVLNYAANKDNIPSASKAKDYVFCHTNISDESAIDTIFEKYLPDCVVHFAAESHVDRSISGAEVFIDSNIVGTFRLLNSSLRYWERTGKKKGFKFLHVSTDEVYGSLPLDPNVRFVETTPYSPNSPYSASKASSDHLVRAWNATYGIPALITNCSNNYGPYQFPEKLIPSVITKCLSGDPVPIYGDGSNIRDWLYVDDHINALFTVLLNGKSGQTYNIGGNNEMSNIQLVKYICDYLDRKVPKPGVSYFSQIAYVTDRPGHDARYAIDSSKITSELGWSPAVSINQGIENTVDWYLDNEKWWRPTLER